MSQISSPSGSSYGVTYTWVQGDTINDPFTVSVSGGAAVNITGYTFWFTIKTDYNVVDPGSLQINPVITSGTAGQGAIQVTKVQTLALSAGNYVFDFVMIDTSGNDTTLMNGTLVVAKRATLSH